MGSGVELLKSTERNGRTFREMFELLELNGFSNEESRRIINEYGKEHFAPDYNEKYGCLNEINRHSYKPE